MTHVKQVTHLTISSLTYQITVLTIRKMGKSCLTTQDRMNSSIFLKPCTAHEVVTIIQCLKSKKSVGYDEVSTIILKACVN